MPRTFNDRAFERLAWDARRLLEHAEHHEGDLAALVAALDAGVAQPAGPGVHYAPAILATDMGRAESHPPTVADVLPRIRQLCVAAREHRQMVEAFTARLTGERIPAARHSAEKVLVVDDAEDTRDLAALTLAASGFHAITAANGLEALIKAHNERPTVILMDVNMPVLDGIEATRLLKAGAATRHIHVIAHTAKAEFLEGPMLRLFAHMLRKPALPSDLVASVRAFMDGNPPEGPDRSGAGAV